MATPGAAQALSAAQQQQAQQALRLLQSGQAGAALALAKRLAADAPRARERLLRVGIVAGIGMAHREELLRVGRARSRWRRTIR